LQTAFMYLCKPSTDNHLINGMLKLQACIKPKYSTLVSDSYSAVHGICDWRMVQITNHWGIFETQHILAAHLHTAAVILACRFQYNIYRRLSRNRCKDHIKSYSTVVNSMLSPVHFNQVHFSRSTV